MKFQTQLQTSSTTGGLSALSKRAMFPFSVKLDTYDASGKDA